MTQQTVAVGDSVVHQVLHAHELQHLIRKVGGEQLAFVQVKSISELTPWMVMISGALDIYGTIHFWEVPADMREIKSAATILDICGDLIKCFDKSAAQLGRE